MRLFVAICLPPAAKAALDRGIAALRQQGRGTFTRTENLHLTLAFIGETTRGKDAARALREVQAPAFSLTLTGCGCFGNLIWAGAELTQELEQLQVQVTRALERTDFALDTKAFRPHLTLCRRFVPETRLDRRALEQALGTTTFPVDEIHLMNSERLNGKLTYTSIFTQPLLPGQEEHT